MKLARPLLIRPRNDGVSPSWMQQGTGYSLPSGPLLRMLRVDPLVGERREVRARRVLVEAIAADAGPRREVVLIAIGRRRQGDVVQRRKLAPNPRPGVVLIGDRVDAQLRDERVELRRRSRRPSPAAAPARACWRRPTRAPRADAGRASPPRGRSSSAPARHACRGRPRPCRSRAGPDDDQRSQRVGARETRAGAAAASAAPARRRRSACG